MAVRMEVLGRHSAARLLQSRCNMAVTCGYRERFSESARSVDSAVTTQSERRQIRFMYLLKHTITDNVFVTKLLWTYWTKPERKSRRMCV